MYSTTEGAVEEKNRQWGNSALNKQWNWRHICEATVLEELHKMLSWACSLRSKSPHIATPEVTCRSSCIWLMVWVYIGDLGWQLLHFCRRKPPSILFLGQGHCLALLFEEICWNLANSSQKREDQLYGLKTWLKTCIKSHYKKIVFCVGKGNCSIHTTGTCC